MARRGAKLAHPRVAPELVLLANGDVWIHGGVGEWSHALRRKTPITTDERWVPGSGCNEEGKGRAAPPADAVTWDATRRCLVPVKRWPGKPAFGQLALADGVILTVGGKRAESAGKFGMRDSAIDVVKIEGVGPPRTLKLAVARVDPTLTELRDGRVVVSGGYVIEMDFSWEDVHRGVEEVEVIDPARDTVKTIARLRAGRYHHGAIEVAPGKLLVVGGSARDGTPLDSVERLTV